MGHRVPNHKSKCRNIHGHTYFLDVTLEGMVIDMEGSSDQGMVIDFSDIKSIVSKFIDDNLDHGYMGHEDLDAVYLTLFKNDGLKYVAVPFVPTAENIVAYLYNNLAPLFSDVYGNGLKLVKLTLWETPKSFVEYEPKEEDNTFKKDN